MSIVTGSTIAPDMPDPKVTPIRYLVSHNGEVKGPFDLDMIEAFILSGHYPKDVRICPEGTDDWKSHIPSIQTAPPVPQPPPTRASKPLGGFPKWVLWTGGLGGVWAVLAILANLGKTTGSSSPSSRASAPSAIHSVSTPTIAWTPPPFSSGASAAGRSFGPTRSATPAEVIYKDTNGRTYRVPHYDYLRLSKQRAVIDQEEAAITSVQVKQKTYGDSIEAERMYLDRTSQYAIDSYNAKIDKLNTAHAQLGLRIDAFNRSVNDFNAELERVGTPQR